MLQRFPEELANLLRALEVERTFIDREMAEMRESCLAKTESRSVLGVRKEFAVPTASSTTTTSAGG